MNWPILDLELPVEKELSLKVMEHQFRQLSREQAIDLLIQVNKQLAIKDQVIKSTLSHALGITNT